MVIESKYTFDLVFSAWESFITTNQIMSNDKVRSEIVQSWKRSKEAGVDPFKGISHSVLSQHQLEKLQKEHKELIDIARPLMVSLYEFVSDTGFIVMLSDENGVVLEMVGDQDTLARVSEFNSKKGACWVEKEAGTNGIGTALVIKKPILVSGPEHYQQILHSWTCAAAPIFDKNKQLIGALQMAGTSNDTQVHTMGMVVAAAEAIKGQWEIQQRNRDLIILNNRLNNIFQTVSDGVIVVDKKGNIVEANPVAESIFSVTEKNIREFSFTNLIDKPSKVSKFLEKGQSFSDIEITLNTSKHSIQCLSSGKPIKDENGLVTGGVVFIKPINDIKKLVNRFSGARAIFEFKDIIGESKKMLRAVKLGKLASGNECNVMLQGESGTGKEVFAHAIHNESSRRNGPFVAVNCGAIPRELISSELFGYEEGAFTGAHRGGRTGKFELASGGTLFLDEIGDMPLEQQIALLRVLQDKCITRLGGNKVINVDVRIICATNKDIQLEVSKGNFRQDLYYRLNVISIVLPPLRERREDIPIYFEYFVNKVCQKTGIDIKQIDTKVIDILQQYDWPGNIREFQNVVERAVNIATDRKISVAQLPEGILFSSITSALSVEKESKADTPKINLEMEKIKEVVEEKEREQIVFLLTKNKANVSQVARELGISRSTLYRKLQKLKISL